MVGHLLIFIPTSLSYVPNAENTGILSDSNTMQSLATSQNTKHSCQIMTTAGETLWIFFIL